jgi:DNA invertase Pin-like site-specific DNA recombinase
VNNLTTQASDRCVAYFRVSTAAQGRSGLGIDAQKAAVAGYVAQHGLKLLVPPYVEIESGRKSDRPKLANAIAHAKRAKATLVVAKLDRLARDVEFMATLMNSGIDFVCCDNPNATRLTIHILAAVAEDEARRISERTKAALAAAKARGTKLGTNNLTREGTLRGAAAGAAAARAAKAETYTAVAPIIDAIQAAEPEISLRGIAKALNDRGERTRYGNEWTASQVMRVLNERKSAAFEKLLPSSVGPKSDALWTEYGESVESINRASGAAI